MDKPSKDGASATTGTRGLGNVDVHYSSGLANHFFYLLSEGSGAKTVNGVSYNSPTSDGCRSPASAGPRPRDLVPGADDVHDLDHQLRRPHRHPERGRGPVRHRSAEYKAVAAAWAAVNVNAHPLGVNTGA